MSQAPDNNNSATFWDHLEVFRSSLLRILLASVGMGMIAFCFREALFEVVLAPATNDFFVYRLLRLPPFELHLINTDLTEQMFVHMKMAFAVGLLVASPYLLYVAFRFVSPALYPAERTHAVRLTLAAYTMFMIGIAANYLLFFPLIVRFLGTYQVSERVTAMLTLQSYTDTLLLMSFMFGIIAEMPVLVGFLTRLGLLHSRWLSQYRKQAFVLILIVSAVITPTGDAFTLLVVSLPIWLLYEVSIWVSRKIAPQPTQ
ncbi:MAG: twin-arginine translocase subunit TatC [Paludibacteraceae bacterium]|nr:twin-arginine translocase subunit TatC [Paludibacteraceae bacterium]